MMAVMKDRTLMFSPALFSWLFSMECLRQNCRMMY